MGVDPVREVRLRALLQRVRQLRLEGALLSDHVEVFRREFGLDLKCDVLDRRLEENELDLERALLVVSKLRWQ